ncbi:MAG: MGMT family protein [Candidatus Odinarchaeum yellowstonii]|uniref:MGMT family protein n=1 Tax=Odinarchaeota yellowstonii (strain LCB_4) TaxID=1841599 RepID=A0AAF0IDC9_ODILC|nr:MAG: MGMT family protein [Candidatus Odinarchaeum yellowstonii]
MKGCCTLTTGIFIKDIASAVEEAAKEGVKLDIPYWRTLKAGGYLNEKYPGGLEGHKKLLEGEGFKVSQRGRKYFVENYQNYLNRLS